MASLFDLGEVVSMRLESLALAEQTMRCTFDWAGYTNIPCTAGPEFAGKVLDISGWTLQSTVKIEVRVAAMPSGVSLPKTNDTVTYRNSAGATGKKYRVRGVKNWYNATIELECVDPNN